MKIGRTWKLGALATFAVVTLAALTPARPQVSMSLTANGSATSAVVLPGSSLTVTVSLLVTSQSVTAVDYYLQVSANGQGKFRITDRSTTGSAFSFPLFADTGDNSANPGVEDSKFNALVSRTGQPKYRNALNLGATIANLNSALPARATPYFLATYVLSVAKDIAPGTYKITTYSDPGVGWVGVAPAFEVGSFSKQGTFTVTVR